jgi:hypothetical protein
MVVVVEGDHVVMLRVMAKVKVKDVPAEAIAVHYLG